MLTQVMTTGLCALLLAGCATPSPAPSDGQPTSPTAGATADRAVGLLATLPVKGRAALTGYDRDAFGQAWADTDRNGCDTRNDILRRDLTATTLRAGTRGCVVLTGTLADPYSGTAIAFTRGQDTSIKVQVDHVVALADAWQTGASGWDDRTLLAFANDPLNLLAVDGGLNQAKGASDAASWLPPNKGFRCAYAARQVAVKARYRLWVTPAEASALKRVLSGCPERAAPRGTQPTQAPFSAPVR